MTNQITLYKKLDQVFAKYPGRDDTAVRLLWLRPLSDRGNGISLMGEKEEFALIEGLEQLDQESRKIAEEELKKHYLAPEISRVVKTDAHFGTRYWEVETDFGPRKFTMKNPYINIRWIGTDELVIRDVIGNTFHIASFIKLDEHSQAEIRKIM